MKLGRSTPWLHGLLVGLLRALDGRCEHPASCGCHPRSLRILARRRVGVSEDIVTLVQRLSRDARRTRLHHAEQLPHPTRECPDCDGAGGRFTGRWWHDPQSAEECPTCEGRGIVEGYADQRLRW